MSQVVGLIEIDVEPFAADLPAACDDATLDGLFARLVASENVELAESSVDSDPPATVIAANLDALASDLDATARRTLASMFGMLGSRR